ncbi:hypothetical protein [Pseudoduganella sp. OTU4001]|uniref:hypothetical protein n=1 Tax=Pseudoduganella sp. OTU4001 TaxID=3043854 RepID=UPI00313B58BB
MLDMLLMAESRFACQMVPSLPPLAWLAQVDVATGNTDLQHGRWLENGPDFVVEGVWDGDFSAGAFDQSATVFGSGVVRHPDGPVFVPSCANTDYLYYRHSGQQLLIANSLPLLLAACGDELDPDCADYPANTESIKKGIDHYQAEIATRDGAVRRLIYRNLAVRNGQVLLLDKPGVGAFGSYEQYAAFMSERCGALLANARDRRRARPLRVLSTQSRGYDSTAVNTVAAPFGIDQVFTISDSKVKNAFADYEAGDAQCDDGSDIAACLGIPCQSIARREYEALGSDEYLYFAGICNSEDLSFAGVVRHIESPSVLLTGTHGELYYPSRDHRRVHPGVPIGSELRRGDLGGGHGLTEVRLQRGFILLPLIYCGARERPSIVDVTESAAMDPWRLGGDYDRPIARRLAESAGVPRALFGQKKLATAAVLARPAVPRNAGLRREFFDFLVERKLLQRWQLRCFPLVHRYNAMLWFASPNYHRWLYYLGRVLLRLKRPLPKTRWRHLNGALYCYAVNRRAGEYRAALADKQVAGQR